MKFLIVDDHALFREGMRHLLPSLESDIVLLEAADVERGLELARLNPDVALVLLDLNMPGSRGLDSVTAFRGAFPTLPLVVLSAMEQSESIRQVLASGVVGFIPKTTTGSVMLSALRLVLAGGVYLPPQLMAGDQEDQLPLRAAPERSEPMGRGSPVSLSPRQLEVLALLVEGKSNKEIARCLGLSPPTVKVHLTTIFGALRVKNRVEAAVIAQRLQLIASKSGAR